MWHPTILYILLGLLMVVSIIELSLVSSTVGFLHGTASGFFGIDWNGSILELNGTPKNFLLDQGHTTNAAAGTAFILVGCGGILALWLRAGSNPSRATLAFYYLWLVVNIFALCLTFGAFVYVFVVTTRHQGQTIQPPVIATLDGAHYNIGTWTPQNWFSAVLKLDLSSTSERSTISLNLRLMRGWQYTLIPFFLIQLMETGMALYDATLRRRAFVSRTTVVKEESSVKR